MKLSNGSVSSIVSSIREFEREQQSANGSGLPRVTGELNAVFVYEGGRTVLARNAHRSPLKITKTHPLIDGRLSLTVMDCSPGILSGDTYRLAFELGRDCAVYLTNQSYTKVHPAISGERSTLEQRIHLAAGARLEYAMQPTMLYKDADLSARTTVEMAAGSSFIYHDVLCPGRTSRGEWFKYRLYSGKLEVIYDGELIFANHLRIVPKEVRVWGTHSEAADPMQQLALWGSYTHAGSLLIFSDHLNEGLVDNIRASIANDPRSDEMNIGVSLTYKHGLAVSALAHHAWHITHLFRDLAEESRGFGI